MVNPDRDDAGHQRTEQTAGIILRDGEKVVISQFFPNIDRNIFIMNLLHGPDQVVSDQYLQNRGIGIYSGYKV